MASVCFWCTLQEFSLWQQMSRLINMITNHTINLRFRLFWTRSWGSITPCLPLSYSWSLFQPTELHSSPSTGLCTWFSFLSWKVFSTFAANWFTLPHFLHFLPLCFSVSFSSVFACRFRSHHVSGLSSAHFSVHCMYLFHSWCGDGFSIFTLVFSFSIFNKKSLLKKLTWYRVFSGYNSKKASVGFLEFLTICTWIRKWCIKDEIQIWWHTILLWATVCVCACLWHAFFLFLFFPQMVHVCVGCSATQDLCIFLNQYLCSLVCSMQYWSVARA